MGLLGVPRAPLRERLRRNHLEPPRNSGDGKPLVVRCPRSRSARLTQATGKGHARPGGGGGAREGGRCRRPRRNGSCRVHRALHSSRTAQRGSTRWEVPLSSSRATPRAASPATACSLTAAAPRCSRPQPEPAPPENPDPPGSALARAAARRRISPSSPSRTRPRCPRSAPCPSPPPAGLRFVR